MWNYLLNPQFVEWKAKKEEKRNKEQIGLTVNN